MDISAQHKEVKQDAYWIDLVQGTNGTYKELMIDKLLTQHYRSSGSHIMDVGCGTCDLILKYQSKFNSSIATCTDYDAKVIAQMKEKFNHPGVEWVVADIFDFSGIKHTYDLVFLLDMLHEIYSFYGRPNRIMDCEIEHDLGQQFVRKAIHSLAGIMNPKGGIVITDNIICEEDCDIEVRLKSPNVKESVEFFLKEYPSKSIPYAFTADNTLRLNSRDFCILLTQYNKVKQQNWARWNVEKMEIHQYLTLKEYQEMFDSLGFDVHSIVGTPIEARSEYLEDFEVLTVGHDIPEKRITLLAIKR